MNASHSIVSSALGSALCLLVAPAALGADARLCVVLGDVSPNDQPTVDDCIASYPTVDEAMLAIPSLPDVDDGSGPRRPSVELSVVPDASAVVTALSGPLEFDLSPTSMTPDLSIDLADVPICGASSSQPAIRVIGGQYVVVQGALIDRHATGPCGGPPGPGLMVDGTGILGFLHSRIEGWQGYAVADSGFGPPPDLNISHTVIARGEGVAVKLRGSWTSGGLIVAYNHLPGDAGEPALLQSQAGRLNLNESAFIGNRIDGGTGGDKALFRGRARMARTALLDNVLSEGTNLLQLGFDDWPYFDPTTPPSTHSEHGLTDLTIGGNRFTTDPSAWAPLGIDVPLLEGASGSCWARLELGTLDDLLGVGTVADGSGELIAIDSSLGVLDRGQVTIARSFVVDNGAAGGPLFRVDGAGGDLSLQLLANTFANNGFDSLMRYPIGDTLSLRYVAARNLAFEPAWGDSIVAWEGPLAAFLVSQNLSEPVGDWGDGPPSGGVELGGPGVTWGPVEFEDASTVLALGDCQQQLLLCPGSTDADCDPEGILPPLFCPVGPAAAYLPTQAWTDANAAPWSWSSTFLDEPAAGAIPGVTGLACGVARFTEDQVPSSAGPEALGDGDGYPSLFDCDNEDPTVFPVLPQHDGYSSPYCVETPGECYRCPNGVNPPPEADDDDSASLDDDDSASLDDDDSATEPPPTFTPDPEPSCGIHGCGLSWSAADVASVVPGLVLFGGWRRRRG